jgi:hypothetical protein
MAVIFLAPSLPGDTEWLARKSPCDKVGRDVSYISDVSIIFDFRPVLFQHGA